MKYKVEDFISEKLIVRADYTKAKIIADHLRKRHINTSCIDDMCVVRESVFYIAVDHNDMVFIDINFLHTLAKNYKIIDSCELDIEYPEKDVKKSFQLNEIVHVIIDHRKTELFNCFAGKEHITAYISAIDEENEMCEIVYLHNVHESMWIGFEDIFHIAHIYDDDETFDEFSVYEDGEEND